MTVPASRAVLRPIEAGFALTCDGCGQAIKFSPHQRRAGRVVANVMVACGSRPPAHLRRDDPGLAYPPCGGADCSHCGGSGVVWDRTEHYHEEHYLAAGEPYGPAITTAPRNFRETKPKAS